MKRFLSPFLLMWTCVSFAQISLSGKVSEQGTNEEIPFANVVLFEMRDTTKIFVGTMTDSQGMYHLENLPIGKYRIAVSYIGYETYLQDLRLSMPSSGNAIEKHFNLAKSRIDIGEVVVKANLTTQKTDHKVVLFNKEQIARATYAKDLLCIIPNINEDPMSGTLKTLQGGGLLILINGVKSTDAQLKMLPPDKVLRVEYYDVPPARYAYVGTVINVITKPLDNGYAFGAETLTAFATGFNNSNAYYSAIRDKHRLDIEYYLNYRDYKERVDDISYEYVLGDVQCKDQTLGKDAFGYTTHTLSFKYAFVDTEKQIFQAMFSPTYNKSFSHTFYEGIYQKGKTISTLLKDWDKGDKTIHPSLDLYYWKKLSDKDELTVNLNLNHFQTKVNDDRTEQEKETGLKAYEDYMKQDNKKQSVIGEVAYSNTFSLSTRLNIGYKMEYSHLLSNLKNLFGKSRYTSDYLTQYAYGEISGMRGKWMYRLSLGLTHIYSKNVENKYNRLLFTPKMILGYSVNDNNSLRLVVNRAPIMPSIGMLSDNVASLTRDIIKIGNPNLTNGTHTQTMLMNTYNNKWLNLTIGAFYQYLHNPINEYFRTAKNRLMLTYRNISHSQFYGGYLQGQIKPFGNDIVHLNVFVQPYWEKVAMPEGTFTHFSLENQFSVSVNYKQWILNYEYVIPSYTVSGLFRSLSENNSNLIVAYKYKNWRFTAGILFVGKDAHYRTETLGVSPVKYHSDRRIRDNNTMFVIGASYHFHTGKQKQVSRKLKNADFTAPSF